jgi:uncharacterized protein YecE (DUF72 family)
MTRVWLGTSGYSYQDWVGPFYPPGTRSGRMLALYSRSFPVVELNFTFYRVPTAAQLARMAEQTPEGFQFIVKLPRLLSHDRDAATLDVFLGAIAPLKNRGRLLGLLCQFPQSTHRDEPARRWVETLGRRYKGCSLAVEFRHDSWDDPEIPAWLGEHGITAVSPDVPDLPGLYPRRLTVSGPRVYVRFHSRNASWHKSSRGRYDYLYSRDQLAEWVTALRPHLSRVEEVLLLFNNCYDGKAIENIRLMQSVLREEAPGVHIVPAAGPGEETAAETE